MTHREGEEPSAFATELEILAVRGFGDIGPQARTRKVRDRFISEQQSCGLRRHLYSAPPDTPNLRSLEIGNMLTKFFSQEGLSPLVARLTRAVQQQNPAEENVPPDAEVRWQQTLPSPSTLPQSPVSETVDQVMVCFSCGCSGHGVSRCSRMDTVFPFLPPGWSVDFRNGQYMTVWPGGSVGRFQSGNEE